MISPRRSFFGVCLLVLFSALAPRSVLAAGDPFAVPGELQVILQPPAAVTAGAAWRLPGEAEFHPSSTPLSVPAGDYLLEYKPLDAFTAPPVQAVSVKSGAATRFTATYGIPTSGVPARIPELKISSDGSVKTMARMDDGRIVIGGEFTAIDGVPRRNLARLETDGSVDLTWNPSPDGVVTHLFLAGDSAYVAGLFNAIGGVPRATLAKVSLLGSGATDGQWDARLSDFYSKLDELGVPVRLRSNIQLMTGNASSLFIYGQYDRVGSVRGTVVKLDARTGAVDARWCSRFNRDFPAGRLTDFSDTLGDLFGVPYAFYATDTHLFLATDNTDLIYKISAATGAQDPAWTPPRIILSVVEGGFVYGRADLDLRRLPLEGSGEFDPAWLPAYPINLFEPVAAFNGFVYAREDLQLQRISIATQQFDPAWSATLPSYIAPDELPFLAMTEGLVAAGVRFIPDDPDVVNSPTTNKTFGPVRFAAADGANDASFRVGVQANTVGLGDFVLLPDGKFILLRGGRALTELGQPLGPLSRFLPDGTPDPTWHPDLDGEVNKATVADNFLYITGDFKNAGGLVREGVARLPLDGDGSADPLWYPSDVEDTSILTHVVHQGYIYLAFEADVGIVGAVSRYPLTGSGELDATWDGGLVDYSAEMDSFPNEPVMLADGDGIYLNGPYTKSIDGLSYRSGIVRMLATGSGGVDEHFKSPVFPITIFGGDLASLFGDILFYDGEVSPGSIGLEAGPKRGATHMASDGHSLFISLDLNHPGRPSHLAKLSLATGAVIPAWKPKVDDTVSAMQVVGDKLYLGGSFKHLNGVPRGGVARVATTGAGALDKTWEFSTDGAVFALVPQGNDVSIAGRFNAVSGFPRLDFAVLPTLDAPIIQPVPDQPAAFTIRRSALDGPFVTHFLLASITGGAVRSIASGKLVAQGEFVTAEAADVGFTFEPLPGAGTQMITVTAALGDGVADAKAPAASYVLNLVARPAAFQFGSVAYSVREDAGVVNVTVLKTGNGAATVALATHDGSAVAATTGDGDYEPLTQRLDFADAENSKMVPIVIRNDTVFRGDRTFTVQLSDPSAGSTVGPPSTATITIVEDDAFGDTGSNLAQSDAIALPAAGSTLEIDLSPAAAHGQWRLAGEFAWRDGGTSATGLAEGNYLVEFRPINGYLEPAAQMVPVLAGMAATDSAAYEPFSNGAAGSLQVFLKPDGIAAAGTSPHAQWRLQGEAGWRDSGTTADSLPAGTYVVEFSDVPAYATRRALAADVPSGITRVVTATYTVAGMVQGQGPVALSASAAATQKPYVFTGQLRTSVGFGSGAAVLAQVVLTAAHVLFDDLELANATQVLWLPQKMRGSYEPPPVEPRGWFVFEGYAAQRQLDNSPGVSSPASQSLDVAAMFFAAPASRGQFSGFLSSDVSPHAWLETSRLKDLAGYPVEGIPAEDIGLMHASGPFDMHFTATSPGVFSTADGYGLPGESGAPLYVQGDDGVYRPAGIYLGGTAQTLVRGIDKQVVDVINRANTAALGDGNNTGGGIVLVSSASANGDFSLTQVTCNLSPALAVSSGAAWRLVGESNWHQSGATVSLSAEAGTATIECKDVSGFLTPAPLRFSASAGSRVVASGRYDPPAMVPVLTGNFSTSAIVDEPFTYKITATQSPSSFAADPLPPGLTLDSGTGVVSGTPTVVDFNMVQLSAMNNAGEAAPKTLALSVLKRGELTVNVVGPGDVTRGFRDTTTRGVGQDLTITAVPNRNAVFTGWTGDIPSAEPRKSFQMPEVLTLTANFRPSPFLTANGAYYGFAQGATSAAAVQLNVSPTGLFTLTARQRGKSYTARGQLLVDGTFNGALHGPGGKLTLAQLALDFTASVKRVTGQIAPDGEALMVRADRAAVFTPNDPSPKAVYTVALPRDRNRSTEAAYPQGDGYGTLRVKASGALTFSGKLGDGSTASASSHLVPGGLWLLAFPGASSASPTVAGEVTLQGDGALTGQLQWNAPALPATSTSPYASGFAGEIALLGSVYQAPPHGDPALVLSGGVPCTLSGAVDTTATLGVGNAFTFSPMPTDALQLSITPATGALTGSFRDSANHAITIHGVILQNQKSGYGEFLQLSGAGFIELNAP